MHNAYLVHIYTPNAYVCICMYCMYLYVSVCILIDQCRYIHTDTYRYIQIQTHTSNHGIHTDTYRYIQIHIYTDDICRYIQYIQYIHDTCIYIQYRHIHSIMGYIQIHTYTYRYTHILRIFTDTYNTYNTYMIHT